MTEINMSNSGLTGYEMAKDFRSRIRVLDRKQTNPKEASMVITEKQFNTLNDGLDTYKYNGGLVFWETNRDLSTKELNIYGWKFKIAVI